MNQQQLKLRFYDGQPPSAIHRHLWTDPGDPQCPFYKLEGNDEAVKYLRSVAFDALGDEFRDCGRGSFVLIGPPPVAIDLVRRFGATLKLPLVEIQPCQVSSLNDIVVEIGGILEKTYVDDAHLGRINIELTPDEKWIEVPPCIVFLNGLESFPPHVVHGLLASLHHPERVMPTEVGWIVNVASVCWVVAASDGRLVDGFDKSLPVISLRESSEQTANYGATK